ncbi:MAG: putative ABC transport system permease protein [Flavobacteriales bacterium]|jgi:putative ABC transport system permease protein
MFQRILFNFQLAMEGVFANQLRAFLTALGIIFGVAAVIAMLAIGTGAKQSILDQMKLIGSNNIVIKSLVLEEDENSGQGNNQGAKKTPWSVGLTLEDVRSLEEVVPGIQKVSPEVVLRTNIIQSAKLKKANCIGITNAFFELNNLELESGRLFHDKHMEGGRPVCIIGKNIQKQFFSEEDPVGQKIKCGNTWLTIIGILEKRVATKENLENLGIRDYNSDVYIPVSTALLRFENRAYYSKADIKQSDWDDDEDEKDDGNYHQLDRVVIRMKESSTLQSAADLIARILKRRHNDVVDYEIQVPELLLQQEQKTQETFNIVLAVIAGISLLVGGIGIMNIMLASVLERIKEIGVRRSLGANRMDIIYQFLFEAIFISLAGGLVGIILGVIAAHVVAAQADIPTVVSTWSIVLSFGVAAFVGLVFGIFPARKAAYEDPIKALRSD